MSKLEVNLDGRTANPEASQGANDILREDALSHFIAGRQQHSEGLLHSACAERVSCNPIFIQLCENFVLGDKLPQLQGLIELWDKDLFDPTQMLFIEGARAFLVEDVDSAIECYCQYSQRTAHDHLILCIIAALQQQRGYYAAAYANYRTFIAKTGGDALCLDSMMACLERLTVKDYSQPVYEGLALYLETNSLQQNNKQARNIQKLAVLQLCKKYGLEGANYSVDFDDLIQDETFVLCVSKLVLDSDSIDGFIVAIRKHLFQMCSRRKTILPVLLPLIRAIAFQSHLTGYALEPDYNEQRLLDGMANRLFKDLRKETVATAWVTDGIYNAMLLWAMYDSPMDQSFTVLLNKIELEQWPEDMQPLMHDIFYHLNCGGLLTSTMQIDHITVPSADSYSD